MRYFSCRYDYAIDYFRHYALLLLRFSCFAVIDVDISPPPLILSPIRLMMVVSIMPSAATLSRYFIMRCLRLPMIMRHVTRRLSVDAVTLFYVIREPCLRACLLRHVAECLRRR